MSTICGLSYQPNRDRIMPFSTQGMAETIPYQRYIEQLPFVRCDSARSLKLHRSELKSLSQHERDRLFLSRDKRRQRTSMYVGIRPCIRRQPEWSGAQSPSSCIIDKKKKKKRIQLKNMIWQIRQASGIQREFQDWPRLAEK